MYHKIIKEYLIPIFAGLIMLFTYDPYGYSFLSVVSIVVFIHLIETNKSVLNTTLLYYVSYSLGTLIGFTEILKTETSDINFIYITLFFLMYSIMFSSIFYSFIKFKNRYQISIYWIVFAWFIFEEVKSMFLGGFPFIKIGGAWEGSFLNGLFPIIGESGVSVIVLIASVSIYQLIKKRLIKHSIPTILIIGVSFAVNKTVWVEVGQKEQVTIVQTNLKDDEKWNKIFVDESLEDFNQILKNEKENQIIIFPETAIPITEDILPDKIAEIRKNSKDKLALIGMPVLKISDAELRQEYSSITAMGQSNDVYLKEKLIPIAEYIPLFAWIRSLMNIKDISGYVGFQGGHQENIKWKEYNIASFICYEISYSSILDERVNASSGFLAVIKNISAFNESTVKDIHFQLIKIRSLESQRYSIVSGNTGLSGIIDIFGNTTLKSKSGEKYLLNGHIFITKGLTPYLRFGDYLIWIIFVVFVTKDFIMLIRKVRNNLVKIW
jgi:apolipoprotein N-acyltransferase